ncbi:MAG: hypothetical protein NVSMB43_14960 [Pseudarthrobacter sp.]
MMDWALAGTSIAHTEKAMMMSDAMTNTRQLTFGWGASMSSAGARLSSWLETGGRFVNSGALRLRSVPPS